MSAWKNPSRSAWRRNICSTRARQRLAVMPGGVDGGEVGHGDALDPAQRHHPPRGQRTIRSRARRSLRPCRCSRGIRRRPSLRCAGLAPARRRLRNARSPRAGATAATRARERLDHQAMNRRRSMSLRKARSMPGRRILTATARPSWAIRALCTCAMEAAATGSEKLGKTASRPVSPISCATTRRASARGKGGSLSCSTCSCSAIFRAHHIGPGIDRIWPNLM